MDQPRLIHQGAARNRRQGIFCRTDAISPQSWGCRLFCLLLGPRYLLRHPEVRGVRCKAAHAERRRMDGPDAAGLSPFEACSAARCAAERAPPATTASRLRGGDGYKIDPPSTIFESQTRLRSLAAHLARVLLLRSALKSKRAQGRPGADGHPRSAARNGAQRDRTAAYRCRRSLGLPCAMVGRLMPCSPGSRTFLLASLAPRIDDAVRPVGLAHISAKGLTVATTAKTTRFCRTLQRRSSARGHGLTGTTRPARTSRARRCRVHRRPGSQLVTTYDRPSRMSRDGRYIRHSRISVK
ncbi:hypothetical protein FHR88_003861 [Bradyrhizobium betae]|nr:hypothetical protein [Bradyrhizobium betae]